MAGTDTIAPTLVSLSVPETVSATGGIRAFPLVTSDEGGAGIDFVEIVLDRMRRPTS